jgi:hypothetical protein
MPNIRSSGLMTHREELELGESVVIPCPRGRVGGRADGVDVGALTGRGPAGPALSL